MALDDSVIGVLLQMINGIRSGYLDKDGLGAGLVPLTLLSYQQPQTRFQALIVDVFHILMDGSF